MLGWAWPLMVEDILTIGKWICGSSVERCSPGISDVAVMLRPHAYTSALFVCRFVSFRLALCFCGSHQTKNTESESTKDR